MLIASQILGYAFFNADLYPQCFSVFGGERRGAPVTSFLRVDKEKILLKCGIQNPDELICFDDNLIDVDDVRSNLKNDGRICLNTDKAYRENHPLRSYTLAVVDARKIADTIGLGRVINTAVLGAYWRMLDHLPFESLATAIESLIPAKISENLKAARHAYDAVEIYEPSHE